MRRWWVPILLFWLARTAIAAPPSTTVLTASDAQLGDAFGRRVSISGDTILVGANGDDERGIDAGAAYVFERDASGAWVQKQKLLPPHLLAGDFFGWSVSIRGDALVVGAPGDDRDNNGVPSAATINRGAAYVYRRVNGTWTLETRLQPQELVTGDAFGWSVAIDVPWLLASAVLASAVGRSAPISGAGTVFSFVTGPSGWQADGTLPQAFPDVGAQFGFSIGLDAGVAIVGFPTPYFMSGGSELFARSGGGWLRLGVWSNTSEGPQDGLAEAATFSKIRGIDSWFDGSVVVLDDLRTPFLRRVTGDGRVTTLFSLSPVAAWGATDGLETDRDGNIYVATQTSVIRRTSDGTERVLAAGFANVTAMSRDDITGDVLVADGCVIRRISPDGQVSDVVGARDECERTDGFAPTARTRGVESLAVAPDGALLFVGEDSALRQVNLRTGQVTTLAAGLNVLNALEVDGDGRVLAAVYSQIQEWTGTGLSVVAGGGSMLSATLDGVGTAATLGTAAMARLGSGDIAFVDGAAVRHLSGNTVTTLAGLGGRGRRPIALIGYDVALRGSRALIGMPGLATMFTGAPGGEGYVVDWSPTTLKLAPVPPVLPHSKIDSGGYGSGVAITREGDIVLGAPNGCKWVAPNVCHNHAASAPAGAPVAPILLFRQDADRRWMERAVLPTDGVRPLSGYGTTLASDGRWLVAGAPEWDYRPQDPGLGDIVGPGRVFVYDLDTLDTDGDTLPDAWEQRFGLDPEDPADAALDPDGDGVTNAQEHAAFSHPRNDPALTRYFAEGATSDFFETRISIANPGDVDAAVALRFLKATGEVSGTALAVPARASRRVVVNDLVGMSRAEFSTTLESDHLVVADRLMTWSRAGRYGSHGETATASASPTWYLAEGATHGGFDLFYLVQNPGDLGTNVRVTYLRPTLAAAHPRDRRGGPLTKTYTVGPRSRFTIWVDYERFAGDLPEAPALANTDVSAVLESVEGTPIIVERAMYRTTPGSAGLGFEAGHDAAGVTAPQRTWFFAEGATGDFFDLFFLVANPHDAPAALLATYLLRDGTTLTKTYTTAANSRTTIWANDETFSGMAGTPLARVPAVSTTFAIQGAHPGVIVERAMWWPRQGASPWTEAHDSPGATTTGEIWATAEGQVSDAPRADTYYLLANPTDHEAGVQVTLLFDDAGAPVAAASRQVPAHSRVTLDVRTVFPEARGRGFGALFHSLPVGPGGLPVPIVVEWSLYNDAMGTFWAAGANALATVVK